MPHHDRLARFDRQGSCVSLVAQMRNFHWWEAHRPSDLRPQIWDISTTPASLLSTFSFPHPVSHVAWDSLERYFFAAGPVPASPSDPSTSTSSSAESKSAAGGSRVVRVNLYRRRKDEFGIEVTEPVGGGGRGELERVGEAGGGQNQSSEGDSYQLR